MATTIANVEAAFVADAAAIAGVISALDHEPKNLPKMPCVTMLLIRTNQDDVETGLGTEVEYEWKINLYCSLKDYGVAQSEMKTLIPALLKITRTNPRLADTCEWAVMTDGGEDPVFAHEDGWLLKSLRLRARNAEQ